MNRFRPFLLLLPLVLLLALGACASGKDRPARPEPPRTTVTVENRSFYQVNVYVVRGGARTRLGEVSGTSTRRFTIPSRVMFGITQLQFLIDPVGTDRLPLSQSIAAQPGDDLRLTIPAF